jgi:hypothetical protein
MTLHRIKGQFEFECDRCREVFDPDTGNFTAAIERSAMEGWRAKKVGDDWTHTCARCVQEARREAR